ncbi:hypothetical protein [Parendozoicomonas haliclonae]|uniref:Uncharacterized protein n=1 Tax=Parendozoicomonas haliclonae TaxID=1960125 RepID=A0A1X7ARH6_9GAMM|nr:hypothetical protein [Parendozoicomonas haliclonae]SMA50914.1 hypothetical protein EHSB41UT_04732 [Parendozoicomonas haliclonae]
MSKINKPTSPESFIKPENLPDLKDSSGEHPKMGKVSYHTTPQTLSDKSQPPKPAIKLKDRAIQQDPETKASQPKKRVGFTDRITPPQVKTIENREARDQRLLDDALSLAKANNKDALVELLFTELSNEQVSRACESRKTMSGESLCQRLQQASDNESASLIQEAIEEATEKMEAYGNEVLLTRFTSEDDAEEKISNLMTKLHRLVKAEPDNAEKIQALLEMRTHLEDEFASENLGISENQDKRAGQRAEISEKIKILTTNTKIHTLLNQIEELELVIDDSRLTEGKKYKGWVPEHTITRLENPQLYQLRSLLLEGKDEEALVFIHNQRSTRVLGEILKTFEAKMMDQHWIDAIKVRLDQLNA